MSRQVQIRRGNAHAHTAFTGAIGEITMDMTNNTLRIHDGEKTGGYPMARADMVLDTDLDNISDTGKNTICAMFMPSGVFEPLGLPAKPTQSTQQTYTCPANGWLYIRAIRSSSGYGLIGEITRGENKFEFMFWNAVSGFGCCGWTPVLKGDIVRLYSNHTSATWEVQIQRFFYAADSVPAQDAE